MKQKSIIITFLILSILVLTSCNKSAQTPEPGNTTNTPEISAPLPTITEDAEILHPTKGPTPTSEEVVSLPESTETPTSGETSSLDLVNELTLEEPARIKWCSDQSCIILNGYDRFSIFSYPEMEELYSQVFSENEFFLDASPDGKTYAMTGNNEDLLLRNWDSGEEMLIPTGTYFIGGEFSNDGSLFMLSSQEQWAGLIFEVETGNLLTTLTGFETAAPVYNIRFGQAKNYAIWIARATIQVSDIATNQIYPAIFHQDFVLDFDMNPEGTLLATSASEAVGDEFLPTVFLYDFVTGELQDKFNTEKAIYSLKFSPDNTEIAYSLGFSVAQYNLETKQFSEIITSSDVAISQILYSPEGTIFVTSEEGVKFNFYSVN